MYTSTIENILVISDNSVATKIGRCKPSEIKPLMDIAEHQSGIDFAKRFRVAKNQLIRIIQCN